MCIRDRVSYVDLCKLFFEIHDPSQTDGIGPDLGPQYRSMIFYMEDVYKRQALRGNTPSLCKVAIA